MSPCVVFFDLFETLVTHFDPEWTPPAQTVAERLGIPEADFAEHWPRFDRAWQAGNLGSYQHALTQLCATAGQNPDAQILAELTDEYRAAYAQPFASIDPEIVAMLSELRDSGLRLGLITNASDLDAESWPTCLLAQFFDDVVVSHRVGLLKPDRRIYARACQRLDVRPGDAIFVGDGGANELAGATAAGMRAYWATWFLDRWPAGIRPNGFPGDEWRQGTANRDGSPFVRVERPRILLSSVLDGHASDVSIHPARMRFDN